MNVIEMFFIEFRFQQFPTRIKLHSIHSNVKYFDWLAGSSGTILKLHSLKMTRAKFGLNFESFPRMNSLHLNKI